MSPQTHRWSLSRVTLAACLALLLALGGQTRADATPAAATALSAVEAATIFCHAGHDADHRKPVLPHHAQEAAVLQAALAGIHLFAIAATRPSLPPRSAVQTTQPGVPQARAPPKRVVASAYPRGPPIPV